MLGEFPLATAREHDPEKWIAGFRKRSCSTTKLERDDDSKKSHHALAAAKTVAPRYPLQMTTKG
jgi:hypothetical protein